MTVPVISMHAEPVTIDDYGTLIDDAWRSSVAGILRSGGLQSCHHKMGKLTHLRAVGLRCVCSPLGDQSPLGDAERVGGLPYCDHKIDQLIDGVVKSLEDGRVLADVPDEDFEGAIADAKADGDLSVENIVARASR